MEREECNPEEKEDYSPPKKKSKSEVLLYFSLLLCFSTEQTLRSIERHTFSNVLVLSKSWQTTKGMGTVCIQSIQNTPWWQLVFLDKGFAIF